MKIIYTGLYLFTFVFLLVFFAVVIVPVMQEYVSSFWLRTAMSGAFGFFVGDLIGFRVTELWNGRIF